jgi:hypothetical protein
MNLCKILVASTLVENILNAGKRIGQTNCLFVQFSNISTGSNGAILLADYKHWHTPFGLINLLKDTDLEFATLLWRQMSLSICDVLDISR